MKNILSRFMMQGKKGRLSTIAAAIIFLLTVFFLSALVYLASRDWVIKAAVKKYVKELTRCEAHIGKVTMDLSGGRIALKNITILNPPQFDRRILAYLPELSVEMDIASFLKRRKLHIRLLRADIRKLNLLTTREGRSNIDELYSAGQDRVSLPQEMPFLLDRFEIKIGTLHYYDQSGRITKRFTHTLNLEQAFEEIDAPDAIVNLVVAEVIAHAPWGHFGISGLVLLDRLKVTVKTPMDFAEKLLMQNGPASQLNSIAASIPRAVRAAPRAKKRFLRGLFDRAASVFGSGSSGFSDPDYEEDVQGI